MVLIAMTTPYAPSNSKLEEIRLEKEGGITFYKYICSNEPVRNYEEAAYLEQR